MTRRPWGSGPTPRQDLVAVAYAAGAIVLGAVLILGMRWVVFLILEVLQ